MIQPHGRRQQGFQCHCAAGGLFKWAAFAFFVLRCVHRADDVDQPRFHGFDNGQTVVFATQGRLDFEECAIVGNVQLIQREVMNGGACGDSAGTLCPRKLTICYSE